MATEVREDEERSHSARVLILIFLVCVATMAVCFSAGFLVGRNERSLHSAPSTEVVTTPGVVPPTVNPPPDTGQGQPPDAGVGHAPSNAAPDTEVIPPGEAVPTPAAAPAKPAEVAPPVETRRAAAKPATPAPSDVGAGITLQVVALHAKQDAEAMVNVLKGKGYPVYLMTPESSHSDDNLFRVLVGPFKTRDDAEKERIKLKQDGFKPFVRH